MKTSRLLTAISIFASLSCSALDMSVFLNGKAVDASEAKLKLGDTVKLIVNASTTDESKLHYSFSGDFYDSGFDGNWRDSNSASLTINKSHVEQGSIDSYITVKNSDNANERKFEDDVANFSLPVMQENLAPTKISGFTVILNGKAVDASEAKLKLGDTVKLIVNASTTDESKIHYSFSGDFYDSGLDGNWRDSNSASLTINKFHVEKGSIYSYITVKNSDNANEHKFEDDVSDFSLPVMQENLAPTKISGFTVILNGKAVDASEAKLKLGDTVKLIVNASTTDESKIHYSFSGDFYDSGLDGNWRDSNSASLTINKFHVEKGSIYSYITVKNSDNANEHKFEDDVSDFSLPVMQENLAPTEIIRITGEINRIIKAPKLAQTIQIMDTNFNMSQEPGLTKKKKKKGTPISTR